MDYHVWGAMLEAYYKLHPKPNSITELEALQVIWDSLSHDHQGCYKFTLRLKRCPNAGGGHFKLTK